MLVNLRCISKPEGEAPGKVTVILCTQRHSLSERVDPIARNSTFCSSATAQYGNLSVDTAGPI